MATPRSRDAELDRESEAPPPNLDPELDFVGQIFDVPDTHWDIETSAEQHPGACTHYHAARQRGVLLQGTDSENIRPDLRWRYHAINPDDSNGLVTQTAFLCIPRFFRRHRLRLYHAGRVRGRLSEADLEALRDRLRTLYGL